MPSYGKILRRRFYWITLIEMLVLLGCALLARLYGYLLFHSTVELFCVFVASAIFAIAWNCRFFIDNRYLLFIGIGYLFVGITDLIHTLSYKGMGVFILPRDDLSIQLWIVGRFLDSATVFIALLFMKRSWRPGLVLSAYAAITALLLMWVFSGAFPPCFIETGSEGMLTPFKVISEYVICLIVAATMLLIYRRRADFDPMVLKMLFISMGLTILSELSFTLYHNVYGAANTVGHIFKLAAYYFVYKAVIRTGLQRPYMFIFRNMKESENALRDANDQLALRSRELQLVNEELEAFARTVAHDLQNPLASMRAFLWVLDQNLKSSDQEAAENSIAKLKGLGDRMTAMIQNLLKLARIRKAELHREPVDLTAMAREMADQLRQRDPQRQAEFSIQDPLKAEGDAALLRIAMENLLDNAWKFSSNSEKTRIEVGSESRDGKTAFFVRDHGIGFSPAEAENLFQTFKRLPGSEDYTGSGIGLASVRRIIERHNGQIWAEAAPGEGAAFFFTLN